MSALALAVLSGIGTLLAVLALRTRRQSWVTKRVAPFVTATTTVDIDDPSVGISSAFAQRTRALLRVARLDSPLQTELARAGCQWTSERLTWLTLAPAFGIAAIALVCGLPFALVVVLAAVAATVPHVTLQIRWRRRIRAFDEQLPDLLDLIVGSLTIGHSFDQSLRSVAESGDEPAASEFQHALGEIRLGRPARVALGVVAERLRSRDLPFVLTAVEIQEQVGGSLASLLKSVADSVRARQQFRRKVKSLTSMGRASAASLLALPFLAAAAITAIQPTYMRPLYHTAVGQELVVASLVLMVIGAFILKRIVSIGV